VSQDTQANPLTDFGRSKLEGKTITRQHADRMPITIIRPPAVYGTRDKDIFQFFQWGKNGALPIVGNPQRQLSLLYVKNLVRGIHAASDSKRAVGESYFLTDGAVHTWRDIARAIAHSLEKRQFRLRVPFLLLDAFARFTEVLAKLRDEPTLNR